MKSNCPCFLDESTTADYFVPSAKAMYAGYGYRINLTTNRWATPEADLKGELVCREDGNYELRLNDELEATGYLKTHEKYGRSFAIYPTNRRFKQESPMC